MLPPFLRSTNRRTLSRFAMRALIISLAAAHGPAGYHWRHVAYDLAQTASFICILLAVILRDEVAADHLTHWDEAAAFLLFALGLHVFG